MQVQMQQQLHCMPHMMGYNLTWISIHAFVHHVTKTLKGTTRTGKMLFRDGQNLERRCWKHVQLSTVCYAVQTERMGHVNAN